MIVIYLLHTVYINPRPKLLLLRIGQKIPVEFFTGPDTGRIGLSPSVTGHDCRIPLLSKNAVMVVFILIRDIIETLFTTCIKMDNKRIQELEEKIADLKKHWPAHSVPLAMLRELDDLEEELAKALEQVHQEKDHA
jgi:predicted RNA-binding Zn ribbon-like protein